VIVKVGGRVPLTCCRPLRSRAGFAGIGPWRGSPASGAFGFGGARHLQGHIVFFFIVRCGIGSLGRQWSPSGRAPVEFESGAVNKR
jgi:hypothetical protein